MRPSEEKRISFWMREFVMSWEVRPDVKGLTAGERDELH